MSREDKPEWIRINLNAFIRDIGYPLGSIGFVALIGLGHHTRTGEG